MTWKNPVAPTVTDSLLLELIQQHEERGPKATAFDTPLRFSSSGDCARALSYQAIGAEVTNPFDAPSIWVTTLGTLIHEKVQDAISRRYPTATFEIKGQIPGVTSGHCDAYIPDYPGGPALYELKTMGGFAFEKSIGLKKQARKFADPEGPRASALMQAAINAYVHQCEWVIIGHISLEGISKGVAASVGMDDIARTIAEWKIPKDVWYPIAEQEIQRQAGIVEDVEQNGVLAGRIIIDEFTPKAIDPEADRPYWKCDYCSYRETCIADGNGIVRLDETVAIRRK